ncbi:MAG: transporter [Paenibacillaceae bacterium]|nr:transporter [Paenibacillaceae bacterium]
MKNWIKGANAAVLSVAVVGIFILLTIFLHSLKGAQWDLTANKKFTLSDKTITTLQNLNQDVHAIAFTDSGQGVVSRQIKDLLDEYQKRSGKFTWEEVDPKKNPSLAQKYEIGSYGTIIFESGGQTKSITSYDLFGYGSDQTTYTFSGESKFTQALVDLTSGQKHIAYAITGHNEITLSDASTFRSGLENEGMEVKELNLFSAGAIPEDAETLIILAPQKDATEQEAALITDFVKNKGKLYMAAGLAGDMEKWTNWSKVLSAVGVQNDNALVVESSKTLSSSPLTIVPQYGYHDIVSKLEEQRAIVAFPAAMSLSTVKDFADYKLSALLRTSDAGYGKKDLALFTSSTAPLTQDSIKKADGDLTGPLDLGYAVTTQDDKPKAVVIGNGMFLRDDWIAEQSNRDFALNSAGWLNEQKDVVTIRPREETAPEQVYISVSKQNLIFWGTIAVFPLAFLAAGGAVWWRRRKG